MSTGPPGVEIDTPYAMSSQMPLVLHRGSCHCLAVRFEVQAPAVLNVIDCNCSICAIKSNLHFIVPKARFKLLQGEEMLTCYRFNSMQAQHLFCKVCGVQSFYIPRSNPDGYGVNPRCLDPSTIDKIVVEHFDGQNWEREFDQKRQALAERSADSSSSSRPTSTSERSGD
ncbi:unnamed protein product [Vitrella brassicaformis CCMP3155]|uniref:CENP-V/GFA domain-containing protein n=2 Tax=Vitrella brassicaformis TaxID=1169539 RepID=A0A0G4EUA5_VITBC|nr:unnamed protein product [Vitrella brassicaformis CCMP3155]|mmetsp:Transcript_36408/g.90946  ORF Transcript_36408/g.90946 Transcript_36408/m.90946 type:complete len:170 (+) Transcript_36408:73-582(+)|eukprot:CEM02233.1 unnamed protein product [Vitrella brassicaformis CCMP3155]